MTPLEHLVTLLLCTFAAWATISAIRRDRNDTGTTRIKLASRIAGPPLLLLLVGAPFTIVILYYLAGFVLIYGLAFVVTAASYGVRNTLYAIRHRYRPPPEPPWLKANGIIL